jgi:MarR family
MSQTDCDDQISMVRAFNRFYTGRLGVLDHHILQSSLSLSEARVLYELANRENPSAKAIGSELGLDPGYLSRIVRKIEADGLISRKPGPAATSARPDRQGAADLFETRPRFAGTGRRDAVLVVGR